jgi:hypothetical protein
MRDKEGMERGRQTCEGERERGERERRERERERG